MTWRGFSVWVATAACLMAQVPVNDECMTAIAVFEDVNPSSPTGDSGTTFTNSSADTSAAFPIEITCGGSLGMTREVFFTYTASVVHTTRDRRGGPHSSTGCGRTLIPALSAASAPPSSGTPERRNAAEAVTLRARPAG